MSTLKLLSSYNHITNTVLRFNENKNLILFYECKANKQVHLPSDNTVLWEVAEKQNQPSAVRFVHST